MVTVIRPSRARHRTCPGRRSNLDARSRTRRAPPSRSRRKSLSAGIRRAPSVGPLAAAMPSSLAFPDILPFPLLSRHRLSADLLALLYLHAVDEHAEVLADRDQKATSTRKLRNTGGTISPMMVNPNGQHARAGL